MRILLACTSYWNSQAEFDARYEGRWLQAEDPRTGNRAYHLDPAYNGKFGLRDWYARTYQLFKPFHTIITCGTWSDPKHSRFGGLVEVVNAGVEPDRPQTNGWQYMGCALTALMAAACNRRDWDVLLLLEPDVLLGVVNWDAILREFIARPELVFGPRWYNRHCEFFGWKPAAASRYVHCRLRPNLTTNEDVMWLDDELAVLFKGDAWNPWPDVENIRQDHPHLASPRVSNDVVLTLPAVRLADPAIVDRYIAECSSLATPVKQA